MTRKTQILHVLDQQDSPVSTNEIADQLGVHWKTVADELEDLYDQGRVDRKELNNRLTLWSTDEIRL